MVESYLPLTTYLGGEPLFRRVAVGDQAGGSHSLQYGGRQRRLFLALLAHVVHEREARRLPPRDHLVEQPGVGGLGERALGHPHSLRDIG
eukprot:scaffold14553_cov74-Phaeocystis_antarctica.AAC.6